jgi:hypothetical protein
LSGITRRLDRSCGIWYRDDILDVLSSVDAANWDIARHIATPQMRIYRQGFEAALQAIAAAFGLSYKPPVCAPPKNVAVGENSEDDSFALLDVDVLTTGGDDDVSIRVVG